MNGSSEVTQGLLISRAPAEAGALRLPRQLRDAAVLIGVWSIPGLISTSQAYLFWQPVDKPFSLWSAFVWQFPAWLFWAPMTPVVRKLCQRFPLERELVRSALVLFAVNLVAGPIYIALAALAGRLAGQEYYVTKPFGEVFLRMLSKNIVFELLVYCSIVALVHAFEYRRRYREGELTKARLETQLAKAQLDALKMQLHPHFLFNTLHAIGVLVRKQDTQGSIRMLTGLSELLRLALDSVGRQVVPLKQELDFLDRYLAIERVRFQDRLTVQMDIAPAALEAQIPNLILQPIVENAIRHGISPRAAKGRVSISARASEGALLVSVRDDGVGLKGAPNGEPKGNGMGLSNVRARLAQLYGPEHRFSIEDHPDGGAIVDIKIPLRKAAMEQTNG